MNNTARSKGTVAGATDEAGNKKLGRELGLSEAKNLKRGQTLYHRYLTNADGTPQRWRVNGAPRTWKREPERVLVPIKRGLYEYGYVTETNLLAFSLCEYERSW